MTSTPASAGRTATLPELRRELGVFSASMMVVGGTIGSGIFFTPAEVGKALPGGAWILGVWAVGGLVALAGALTYAELGAMFPDAGGAYVYIRRAFGPLASFLCGWMTTLAVATGALAAVAMGFAGYVERFVPLGSIGGPIGLAAVTLTVLAVTNYVGIRPGAAVQNVLTIAKIAALVALVAGGLAWWVSPGAPPVVPDAPPPRASIVSGVATAFVAVLFTIGGWQQLNMVAGEIRDPERSIPRALTIGVLIVVALYLGVNAVYLRFLGRDGLAATTAVAADTAARMVGPVGVTFISLAAMLSILGFINVALLGNSRIPYAMARDGAFLAAAGRVHARFGTPHVSIVLIWGWSILLLLASRGQIGDLLSGVVFADWIFFGLGAASVFMLRRRLPDAPRPYKAFWYPVVPALFVVAAVVGVVSAIISAPMTSAFGFVLLLAGVGWYRWMRRTDSVSC